MNAQHSLPLPVAIAATLAIVVVVRELAVLICTMLGYPNAANIVGLVTLFLILIVWRWQLGLPRWLTNASSVLLLDSGFAFLPVSAGAGVLMFQLGNELIGFVLTIFISTLLPLWGFAWLSRKWLPSNHITQSQKRNENT